MPVAPLPPHFVGIVRDALEAIQTEITGQIVNTAQSLIDVWEIDCEGEWLVYVKTALTAFGAAIWLLLTPSLEEILESYLHPKPGRRHGRRGQRGDRNRTRNPVGVRRIAFNPPIPDIDNAIADAIPGRSILAGRNVGPGEYIFWGAIDVADRFLWYWLLIEAAETFATTWQSELLESGKCKSPNDASCQFTTPKQTPFFSNNLWFNAATLIGVSNENFGIINNGLCQLDPANLEGTGLTIVQGFWTVESSDPDTTGIWDVGIRVRLLDFQNNVLYDEETRTTISVGPDGTATAQVDIGFLQEDVNRWDFNFVTTTIQGASFSNFECWARVGLAARNVHVG